jgi:hypothetical protein
MNFEIDPMDKYRYGDMGATKNMSFMQQVQQALMDQKIGLDREKIEEIEEKMEEIINDKDMPADQKAEMLQQLNEERKAEFEKAAKNMTELSKKQALQPNEEAKDNLE